MEGSIPVREASGSTWARSITLGHSSRPPEDQDLSCPGIPHDQVFNAIIVEVGDRQGLTQGISYPHPVGAALGGEDREVLLSLDDVHTLGRLLSPEEEVNGPGLELLPVQAHGERRAHCEVIEGVAINIAYCYRKAQAVAGDVKGPDRPDPIDDHVGHLLDLEGGRLSLG
jgi:hypothetical protein